jgi:hypothetical protein
LAAVFSLFCFQVFEEHEELRKSLWKPRYTPVSFSLLLTATARAGPDLSQRLDQLPRVLGLMQRHGIFPRTETCHNLLGACIAADNMAVAAKVVAMIDRSRQTVDAELLQRVRGAIALAEQSGNQASAKQLGRGR